VVKSNLMSVLVRIFLPFKFHLSSFSIVVVVSDSPQTNAVCTFLPHTFGFLDRANKTSSLLPGCFLCDSFALQQANKFSYKSSRIALFLRSALLLTSRFFSYQSQQSQTCGTFRVIRSRFSSRCSPSYQVSEPLPLQRLIKTDTETNCSDVFSTKVLMWLRRQFKHAKRILHDRLHTISRNRLPSSLQSQEQYMLATTTVQCHSRCGARPTRKICDASQRRA